MWTHPKCGELSEKKSNRDFFESTTNIKIWTGLKNTEFTQVATYFANQQAAPEAFLNECFPYLKSDERLPQIEAEAAESEGETDIDEPEF